MLCRGEDLAVSVTSPSAVSTASSCRIFAVVFAPKAAYVGDAYRSQPDVWKDRASGSISRR